ncbi:MAG: uncharacterized protein A8A55_2711, partial [Amphiamblys sp. WSBS2006]
FGLLINQNTSNLLDSSVCALKETIRRKGRFCVAISIGDLTLEKIANFPEIDVFVNFSCKWSSDVFDRSILEHRPVLDQEIAMEMLQNEGDEEETRDFLDTSMAVFEKKSFKGL